MLGLLIFLKVEKLIYSWEMLIGKYTLSQSFLNDVSCVKNKSVLKLRDLC